ncbi:MAG: hypothetical protein HOO06_02110 [Bdellovibrionaceae bacterium]|jgi:hypothetical protein|nr:hypothetical protein [Pseudobdellovibrionaceae bacterium]
MIGNSFFIIRTFIITFIVVMVLQIRIGDNTLEERAVVYMQTSQAMKPVHEVVHGGVLAIKGGFKNFMGLFQSKTSEFFDKNNLPGHRTIGFQLRRSQKYISEKVKDARDSVEKSVGEEINQYKDQKINELSQKRSELRKKLAVKNLNTVVNDGRSNEDIDEETLQELQDEGLEVLD